MRKRQTRISKRIKTYRCDVCGEEKPRARIRKFKKKELGGVLQIKGVLETTKWRWKKSQYSNIPKNNPNFTRQSKICEDCL